MNIGIYFNKDEVEWIKNQPEGTVRELVQSAMGGVGSKIGVPVVKKVVPAIKNVDSDFNPNICTECNHVKVAGKCINKDCSKKNKLV